MPLHDFTTMSGHVTDDAMQQGFLVSTTFDTAIRAAATVSEALWLAKRLRLIVQELMLSEDAAMRRAETLCGGGN